MELRVTSVSRKSEPLASAPAPIYVITQEEIRRSGMTQSFDGHRRQMLVIRCILLGI
jgi:hypothetical protein